MWNRIVSEIVRCVAGVCVELNFLLVNFEGLSSSENVTEIQIREYM